MWASFYQCRTWKLPEECSGSLDQLELQSSCIQYSEDMFDKQEVTRKIEESLPDFQSLVVKWRYNLRERSEVLP